jgi:hypothetical protein
LVPGSVDGKNDAKVKGDENTVVVGKEEAFRSSKKADMTANLSCMDRLQEQLSCAVRGIHLVVL